MTDIEQKIAEAIEKQFSKIGYSNWSNWTSGVEQLPNGDLIIELDGELNISELVRSLNL